jgi:D-amino-acid dehydrogenase
MKVLVLGSGVVGVASAWYLNQAGHDVTVVDRQPSPAMETSFANGGQISWSSATPWAAPNIPLKALGWLFKRHSPLFLRPKVDPAMWRWLWQMLSNCTRARFEINRERMVRLARYSHDCLVALRADTGIAYAEHKGGTLIVYRALRDLHMYAQESDQLQQLGIPFRVFDRAACVAQEPALAPMAHKIFGGMYFPHDEQGDCHTFTEQLAQLAISKGVKFRFGTDIEGFRASADRIEALVTNNGEMAADMYIAACGSYTPLLLRRLGIRLPVYPIKGYSVTIPVRDAEHIPSGTLTDEYYKVVVTRLGDRIRAAGTAEVAGYDLTLRESRCATIAHVVRDLFPDAGDFSRAEYWCGLRPMTPDNPPVVGATPFRNLLLNTGHGTLGWTMACGSGKVVADMVSGIRPKISIEDYAMARYS